MCSKFKVFLLTGFFLLITTVVFAEPFWIFKTGHTIKYTRTKFDGTNWLVTMTIGDGGQNVCGQTDYYKLDEYNYDNEGETSTKYLKMTETEGWQCDPVSGMQVKFLEVGQPEGYGWTYPPDIAQDDDGTRLNIVSVTRFGSQITMRRWSREGGINKPAVYNTYVKGFGLMKETDQLVDNNAPWTQARHGFRGRTLYANFTGYGLYSYDYEGTGSWNRIHTITPDKMVHSGPNLYAAWNGYGLYLWDGTTWTKIHTVVPASMITLGWTLYAIYPGYGLYKFTQDGNWTRINTVIPTNIVASGTNLYAIFNGYGLYKYDGTTWSKIHQVVPASIVQGQN